MIRRLANAIIAAQQPDPLAPVICPKNVALVIFFTFVFLVIGNDFVGEMQAMARDVSSMSCHVVEASR